MDILSIEIRNFGPIEHTYLNLNGQGLVNIEGDNRDDPSANSNGSGKSTIPDALSWCLWGTTARGIKGDEVVAGFAGKDCVVAVLIQDGDDRYMIERWRKAKKKGKTNGLSLHHTDSAGNLTDMTGGTDALTQEKIVSILGCTEEVWNKAIYSGQEAMPDLPNMTDKAIKELVEESAGIEILTTAYALAREDARMSENERQSSAQRVTFALDKVSDAEDDLSNVVARSEAWGGEQKGRIATVEAELESKVENAKAIARRVAASPVAPLEAELTALRASLEAVEGERVEERRLATEAQSASRVASSANDRQSSAMTTVRSATKAFKDVESKVGSPCDECGKPHTAADVADVKRIAADRLRTASADAEEAKKDFEAKSALADKAEDALNKFRAGMTDLTATIARQTEVSDLLRAAQSLLATLDEAKRQILTVKGNKERLLVEENPFAGLIENAQKTVEARKAAVAEAERDLAEKTKLAQIDAAALKVFGPAGVRAYVLDTVTPYLNERTAHYLGTLSDGRIEAVWTTLAKNAKGELTEKFAIEVQKTGGGQSFKALSGGEKRKVRLAATLALQDLVASRATKPVSLWVGDEIDDALDEAGLERLMAVLEEKSREKGTVLVISHNSLRDWIRETTVVTMEDGKSTVTGALC